MTFITGEIVPALTQREPPTDSLHGLFAPSPSLKKVMTWQEPQACKAEGPGGAWKALCPSPPRTALVMHKPLPHSASGLQDFPRSQYIPTRTVILTSVV